MANEISIAVSMNYSKNGITATLSKSISVTQSGADHTLQTQLIGFASAELLDIGTDIGTTGYVAVVNLDSTNFVELSLNDFTQKFAKLRPGEPTLIPVSTGTIYAKADTAAVQIGFLAIEL